MNAHEIRRWIGAYVLILTAVLGAYLLLAGGSWLLPLEDKDVTSAFQIVIPFLLGQVVLTYKFFASGGKSAKLAALPSFFVKMPLLAVTLILFLTFLLMGIGGYQAATWTPSSAQFKGIVTFTVALLNASTVFITTRYFEVVVAEKEEVDK